MALAAIAVAVLVSKVVDAQAPGPDTSSFVQGEKTLEARLLAPCCWTQTLDTHESEVAHSLRAEIRKRLAAGDNPDAIENDIVARYGERIRAVPKGGSLTGMGVWLSIAVAISGLGVGYLVVRWARKGKGEDSASGAGGGNAGNGTKPRDEWDDRLDKEVGELPD
jgi:cytochrome c-type biogenesis protein CcmH